MGSVTAPPPYSLADPVKEIFHGTAVIDPYRWLEEHESARTRVWIEQQSSYARTHLDNISGRERIQQRVQELLAVDTYEFVSGVSGRHFFRKRTANQEQFSIYMRHPNNGEDVLLVDPEQRGTGKFTAVRPVHISSDGRLLLYEVREGGERTGVFELLDIPNRRTLPDALPRGWLRGFAFSADCRSFHYVHEPLTSIRPFYRAANRHRLGTPLADDEELFFAGELENIRLCLMASGNRLGFMVHKFSTRTRIDFHVKPIDPDHSAVKVVADADCSFRPLLLEDRLLAITGRDAPNLRVVEIRPPDTANAEWIEVIPEQDARIHDWLVVGHRIFVSYHRGAKVQISIFDLAGRRLGEMPIGDAETVRLIGGGTKAEECFIESESFVQPTTICRYVQDREERERWAETHIPLDPSNFRCEQIEYASTDGTPIPMSLMVRRDLFDRDSLPTIMTSYGGFGISMTPRFSVFVAFLVERGCLFALPNIRGGSEFGAQWHNAAKRRNRQVAFDDFLCAADWLIASGRTRRQRLAIFGGSNSGLLVAAALTQRPELFRAVVCMTPLLDMLRYHLFDNARAWVDEYGSAEDPDDFSALIKYSPYHRVQAGVGYPATMIVSGDADRTCNPLHARKMTARLQAANVSQHPIVLEYNKHRGHLPGLPLSVRIATLTDRLAFLCDQLELAA